MVILSSSERASERTERRWLAPKTARPSSRQPLLYRGLRAHWLEGPDRVAQRAQNQLARPGAVKQRSTLPRAAAGAAMADAPTRKRKHKHAEASDNDSDGAALEPAGKRAPPPSRAADALEGVRALVGDEFQCAVCLGLVVAPHVLSPCAHRFCGVCILEWAGGKSTCPACRAEIKGPPAFDRAVVRRRRGRTVACCPNGPLVVFLDTG